MSEYFGDIIRSVGFLSRLPMPRRFFGEDSFSLSRVVQAFPVAGLLIALPSAILFLVILWLGATPLFAALATLATLTLATGALHEDGLADTADGFWGGKTKERSLEIMKDSHIGTYGVVALILSFGLRAAALAGIAGAAGPVAAAVIFIAVETLARTTIVWHWSATSPARLNGVAASAGKPEARAVRIAITSGVVLAGLIAVPSTGIVTTLIALVLTAGAVFSFTSLTKGKIGGHTGDTLGACEQIATVTALSAFAVFL